MYSWASLKRMPWGWTELCPKWSCFIASNQITTKSLMRPHIVCLIGGHALIAGALQRCSTLLYQSWRVIRGLIKNRLCFIVMHFRILGEKTENSLVELVRSSPKSAGPKFNVSRGIPCVTKIYNWIIHLWFQVMINLYKFFYCIGCFWKQRANWTDWFIEWLEIYCFLLYHFL